jgi:hypothetical protein
MALNQHTTCGTMVMLRRSASKFTLFVGIPSYITSPRVYIALSNANARELWRQVRAAQITSLSQGLTLPEPVRPTKEIWSVHLEVADLLVGHSPTPMCIPD